MLQFLLGLDSAAGSSSVTAVVVSPVIDICSSFRNPTSMAGVYVFYLKSLGQTWVVNSLQQGLA